MEPIIQIKNVTKTFIGKDNQVEALKGISLDINKGDIYGIIGMSGAGKSTLVRCLNYLEKPTTGTVVVEDQDLSTLTEAELRKVRTGIAMIFQHFNLLMQRSVLDNVCFPMEIVGVKKQAARKRAMELLEIVGLKEKADAYPSQLSGGQKQRVAIARALANNPRVLLLDEPLGALDLQLRRTMQLELKRLQKKLGITFIYITHDQEEAINMSDRIVVMNQGQFEQIGTPDEIYNHPKTSYVATFVGNANILKGKVVEINGSYAQVQIGNDTVSVYTEEIVKVGEQLTLAVRSENILLDEVEMENVVEQNEAEGTGRHLYATVKEKNFAAGQLRVLLALSDGTELTASRFGMNANIQPGQQIKWYFDPRNAIVVDREFKTKEPADMSGGNQ